MTRRFFLASATASFARFGHAQTTVAALLERKLIERIQALDREFSGVLGVAAIDLETGSRIDYNSGSVFPQASSIKIPILIETFRQAHAGIVRFDEKVTLTGGEAAGGSGHLRLLLRSGPITVTTRELATAMIETSDNTATNRLIAIPGIDSVNAWLKAAGFEQTKLQRRMLEPGAAAADRENVSTPSEMARLVGMLYRGECVSSAASREMIEILKLPSADFRLAIPAEVPVASKPGAVTGVRAETGIIFLPKRPFVLSVMSTYLDAGSNPVPAVVKLVYEHFEKLASANRYGHKLQ